MQWFAVALVAAILVVLVTLLAFFVWGLRSGRLQVPGGQTRASGRRRTEATDRQIIVRQLHLGVGLIVFGSLLVAIYIVVLWLVRVDVSKAFGQGTSDTVLGTIAVSTATAVIGAGAALLPGGAATGASYRILDSLSRSPDLPVVTTGEAVPDPTNPDRVILRGTIEPKGRFLAYRFVIGGNQPPTSWKWPGDPQAPAPLTIQAQESVDATTLPKGRTYQLVAQAEGQEFTGAVRTY